MSAISAILRPAVVALLMMLGLLAYGGSADQRKQKDSGLPRRQQVIGFLTESVEWYRSSSFEREIPIHPADIPLRENAQAVRLQILRLSLDYAKALAADQARGSVPRDQRLTLLLPMHLDRTCSIGSRSKRNVRPRRETLATMSHPFAMKLRRTAGKIDQSLKLPYRRVKAASISSKRSAKLTETCWILCVQ